MRYTLIAALLIPLLGGCGEVGLNIKEPSHARQTWIDTMQCTGLSGTRPTVEIVPDIFWNGAGADNIGLYLSAGPVVLIKESEQRDIKLLSHEYTHGLLYENFGDLDASHRSPLFSQCGYSD